MTKMSARIAVGALALLLTCLFLIPASTASAQNYPNRRDVPNMDAKAVVPLVTLRHWKESKPNERYAFLVGMVTVVEMEKEWQLKNNKKMTAKKQSLAGSWVRGFENRSLKELYDGINSYIAANPGDLDRPVPEVMWFTFVQPRVDAGGKKR